MSEGKRKSPFVVPPPTIEELGVMPVRQAGWSFKVYRSVFLLIFFVSTFGSVATYFWLEELGVFNIDANQLVKSIPSTRLENTVVLDRNGEKIGEYFTRYQIYVPFDEIPKQMVNAILAIEDRSFFSHLGIDIKAIIRAAKESLDSGDYNQGASTITQQLVRNIFLSKEKSIARKVKEIAIAIRLERVLSKEKIFELYANQLFLGFGAYGIAAAAHRYFGKDLEELDVSEMALIAGLFQSPSNYNPTRFPKRAKNRQRQVIKAMYAARMLEKNDAQKLLKKELTYANYQPINELYAPYFLDFVREQVETTLGQRVDNSGLRIHTTLDLKLQKAAIESFQQSENIFTEAESMIVPDIRNREEKPKIEAAMLSIDPTNGEILTMIGGRDYADSKYNRTVQAQRSPGSAFKPIVYSLALERGRKWSDVLLVSPISIDGYRPKNYTEDFLSETTLLRAFYLSLNTAAVEVGTELGLDAVIEQARKLGIRSSLKREAGTIIGSSGVTMLDLARVYSSFANLGNQVEPIAVLRIEDQNGKTLYTAPNAKDRSTAAIAPQIAYLITEGLRQVLARGTGIRASELSDLHVGKTGTSNDSVDNWFCGYSNNLVSIVWLGNDKHLPLSGPATGSSLAIPVWKNFTSKADSLHPSSPFKRPGGIIATNIHPKYGHRDPSGIRMFFTHNNGPKSLHSEFQAIEEKGSFRSLFTH